MSMRAIIQHIAAARGLFLEHAKPGDSESLMRFRVPTQHGNINIEEILPSIVRNDHRNGVALLDRVITDLQRTMFRVVMDHIAKYDREPLDRLEQIETAARDLLDALGPVGFSRTSGPITKAALDLEQLLRAKPGAVSWQLDGYGKDP